MLSLKNCKSLAVIGAGGKMGSGISLLILEMLAKEQKFPVSLIDTDQNALIRLKKYLRAELQKNAERGIIALRKLYQDQRDLVENREIIDHHVASAFETVFFSTSIEDAQNKDLVFEAVFEEIDLKVRILKQLKGKSLVLSNTSSIPIHFLEEEAGLKGRIAGFHFYNPPAIQKLVELVIPDNSHELADSCNEIGKELGKICVPSKDVAGFIGNGIFMREILFTLKNIKKMKSPLVESILTLDLITKTFLFRPMGIFQLLDYVGIDIAVNVLAIMSRFLDDPAIDDADLLKKMLSLGKKGGHKGDSGQQDGFFRYADGQPVDILDPDANQYVSLKSIQAKCESAIGTPLTAAPTWKMLSKEQDPEKNIRAFYIDFIRNGTLAADTTMKYLLFQKDISFLLVKTGVAKDLHDITMVLKLGFYHLFGPDSPFIQEISLSQGYTL